MMTHLGWNKEKNNFYSFCNKINSNKGVLYKNGKQKNIDHLVELSKKKKMNVLR